MCALVFLLVLLIKAAPVSVPTAVLLLAAVVVHGAVSSGPAGPGAWWAAWTVWTLYVLVLTNWQLARRAEARDGLVPAVGVTGTAVWRRQPNGPVTAAVAVGGLTAALLARMRRELLQDGRLSAPTVTVMYGAYTLHGLVVGVSAWRRSVQLGPRTAAVGLPLTAAGSGLVVAGMSRFVSASQVNGTQVGELASGGVYRLSRNPQ